MGSALDVLRASDKELSPVRFMLDNVLLGGMRELRDIFCPYVKTDASLLEVPTSCRSLVCRNLPVLCVENKTWCKWECLRTWSF